MLSYGLRMELKDAGINITCICPGDIRTNFSKNRDKNFATNSRYGNKVEESAKQIDTREPKRMTVEYASSKVFKICNKKKTKPMYVIGRQYKFLHFLQKVAPLSWILHFTRKYF